MTQSKKTVYVAIVGVGGVGSHVIEQIDKLRSNPIYKHIHPILITSSTKSSYIPTTNFQSQDPISPLDLSKWRSDLDNSTQSPLSPDQIVEYLLTILNSTSQRSSPNGTTNAGASAVLIDNTSSPALVSIYPRALSNGISIVTPNKKAFSGPSSEWSSIASSAYPNPNPNSNGHSGGLLYHESTVGAGLPIISTLKDLLATGDKVRVIEGVFSGTMSFLFNTFDPITPPSGESPPTFSQVVRTAQSSGYTEPDPRDDLNGADVARKLTILARLIGLEVSSYDSFPTESLIPAPLQDAKLSKEDFMERLGEYDGEMEMVREKANKGGKVVRYTGRIDVEKKELRVGLGEYEKGSAVGGLKGSDNLVGFYTERYGENALVVQGAGAGGAVTAMGVTADLIKVVERLS